MPSEILYISMPDLIRADFSGDTYLQTTMRNLKLIVDAWTNQQHKNILIDVREAHHKLTPQDIRELVEEVVKTGIGVNNRVAIVYTHREPFDRVRFFEFLTTQKGLGVKACEEFEEAFNWLSHPSQMAS